MHTHIDYIGRTTWVLALLVVILLCIGAILISVVFVHSVIIKKNYKKEPKGSLKRELLFLVPIVVIGLIFFAVRLGIKLCKYSPDEWRFAQNYIVEDEKTILKVLKAADSGDRDKLANEFSIVTRKQLGFDEELDAFLEAYPGLLAKIELDNIQDQMLSGQGHKLDNGIYVSEQYRSAAGFCNGQWYWIYISFIDYCKDDPTYIGITKLIVLSAGARINIKLGKTEPEFDFMYCDMTPPDTEFRIIANDAFEWHENANVPITSEEMIAILEECTTFEDLTDRLGLPNTYREASQIVTYRYYYEAFPENGEPRYFCVVTDEREGAINYCYLCGTATKRLAALYDRGRPVPTT